ncbi:MAG: ribonuclease III [Alphaproteobacteria bacterium]|nr:ribonuclease III [Alphaproteobacteria bacterium]
MRDLVDAIEAITDHRFADLGLLLAALTHGSYTHEHPDAVDYERLEFLGDAVVGLCTTRLLVDHFPSVPEGDLTDLRQRVVNTRTLGELGRRMGLSPHVRLGQSERSKKQVEVNILGDVVEALFAAVYREAGYDAAQAMAARWLHPLITGLEDAMDDAVVKNAVNRLQEHTQKLWKITPDYTITGTGPDHRKQYTAVVHVQGEELATGSGSSGKEAKKRAANAALQVLRARDEGGA